MTEDPSAGQNPWSSPAGTEPTIAGQPAEVPPPAQPTGYPPAPYQPTTFQQPEYQQPGQAQPGYQQPGYPQPGYQQPGYQPGFAQPGYQPTTAYQPGAAAPQPMYYDPTTGYPAAPPPKKMSGVMKALLIAIPIVLVLAAIGVGVALAGGSSTPKAASNTTSTPVITPTSDSPAPTDTPTDTPTTPPATSAQDTFTMPATALGWSKSKDSSISSMIDGLKQSINDGTTTAAAYQSKSNPKNVLLLIGVATDLTGADQEFQDSMYSGLSSELDTKNKKSYSAGSMGGIMWCADGEAGLKIGICSVADNGGAFIVMYFNHTGTQAASIVPGLRSKVEKQS